MTVAAGMDSMGSESDRAPPFRFNELGPQEECIRLGSANG